MKAQRFLYGSDTYGRSIERAQSTSGAWFWREYGFNGYGKGWSKWQEETPETPEEWGFNKLTECDEPPKVRLPK